MEVEKKYGEACSDLHLLIELASRLSTGAQDLPTNSRNLELGKWLFAKLVLHARAIYILAPQSPIADTGRVEFWDLSSMATLVRAVIDTYFMQFYVAVDVVEPDMREFRWLLWDHHSELRTLEQLQLIGSTATEITVSAGDYDSPGSRR